MFIVHEDTNWIGCVTVRRTSTLIDGLSEIWGRGRRVTDTVRDFVLTEELDQTHFLRVPQVISLKFLVS